MDDHPRRGDVFFAFLDPVLGCEQGGTRPVLVVQNDAGNRRSKTIIVAAITGKPKANLPVHVPVPASAGLREGSVALLEQLRTIDKLSARTHTFEIPVSKTVKFGKSLFIKARACRSS